MVVVWMIIYVILSRSRKTLVSLPSLPSSDPSIHPPIHLPLSAQTPTEGLSFTYRFNLYRNIRFMDESGPQQLKCLLPCTALSVVKILEAIGGYDMRYNES